MYILKSIELYVERKKVSFTIIKVLEACVHLNCESHLCHSLIMWPWLVTFAPVPSLNTGSSVHLLHGVVDSATYGP